MTTVNSKTPADQATASSTLAQAVTELEAVHARFAARELSSLEHSRAREAAISKALTALATMHGVVLQAPLQINSLGEYSITATEPGSLYTKQCGHYGTLAEVLNRHNPRCGAYGTTTLLPESGWCYMNHFDAERMVREENSRPAQSA